MRNKCRKLSFFACRATLAKHYEFMKLTTLPVKRLWKLVLQYKSRMLVVLIGMLITAGTEPLFPIVLKYILDDGFVKNPSFSFWLVPLVIVGIFIFRGLSTFMTDYTMAWITSNLVNNLREQMYVRVLRVSRDFYSKNSLGQVVNSLMYEAEQIVEMLRNVMTSMIRDVLTVVGLLVYLLWLNWRLTLVTMIIIPVVSFVMRYAGRRLRKLSQDYRNVNADLTKLISETTRASEVIKIFSGEVFEENRFKQFIGQLRRYLMKMVGTQAAVMPITQLVVATGVSIVILIALIQSSYDQTTAGGFVSFITAMLMMMPPLRRLADVNSTLQRGIVATESVFNLVDSPIERQDGIDLTERVKGKLEFDHVTFSYEGQKQPALSDINLTINPGETLALVGMSGGGKSTLSHLVPEFYAPASGEIRLDGIPISTLSLKSLRSQIAMVNQQVVLFDGTVAENVAYGDFHPDRSRIEAAIEAAYLKDVIDQLPEGLNSPVGVNGMSFSGGQRQRIAIARAIYKDAPILILDEATSALDTESEKAVQQALYALMKGRTTIVIAHRLSTIEHADRIAVITNGKIVEIGTHDELLAKNGTYSNLYHLQFKE